MFSTSTNSDHSVERKIKDLSDLEKYLSVPKSIKKSLASEKYRCTSPKLMYMNLQGWLSMVNLHL